MPVQERRGDHGVLPTVLLSKPLNSLINRRNPHGPKTEGGRVLDLHAAGDLAQDPESEATYETGGAQLAPAAAKAQGREEGSTRTVTAMTAGRKRCRKGPRRKDTLTRGQDLDPDPDQGQSPERGEENEHFHIGLPQDQGTVMKQDQKGKGLDQLPETQDGERMFQKALAAENGTATKVLLLRKRSRLTV